MSKEEILRKAERIGYHYEKTYYGCSQCLLTTIQELFGLESEAAFKAASAFAGGIALMGSVCGALTGGVMALGLKYGRSRNDIGSYESLRSSYAPVQKLYKRFEEEFGTTICYEIQKRFGGPFDLKDPEQYEAFQEATGYHTECAKIVGKTARMVAEIMLEEG